MAWTTECVVDIMRRAGPGALATERLRQELRRARPPILLTRQRLELLVEESEGRVALLEVWLDDPARTAIASWVLLTDPHDAPTRPWHAAELWRSLAAMAEDIDKSSRTEVSRWIRAAHNAALACSAVRSVPPSSPRRARRFG